MKAVGEFGKLDSSLAARGLRGGGMPGGTIRKQEGERRVRAMFEARGARRSVPASARDIVKG